LVLKREKGRKKEIWQLDVPLLDTFDNYPFIYIHYYLGRNRK